MEYPLNVYTSVYRPGANIITDYATAADLGSTEKWAELVDFLKENTFCINSCSLPVDENSVTDLCTPLHNAAKGKAPKEVFKEILDLKASKSLKNADGKTAYDIAKSAGLSEEIQKMLEPPKELLEKEAEIQKMESGLHQVILGRADDLIRKNGQQLPQVGLLYEFGKIWYPIPGMYGGFSITKHEDGIQAESWCRVAGGSGQRHVIDREGNVELVEEGFV